MAPQFHLFENATDVRTYRAGQTIFQQGDQGAEMFVIRSGKVDITFNDKPLESLGQGNIFGEMALIDSAPRRATATATSDCELVPITAGRFEFMVQETPNFALTVMKVMSDRLRRFETVYK
jgi:CRP/FNR family transcriptional regulator, cyclic AMP receptor protein